MPRWGVVLASLLVTASLLVAPAAWAEDDDEDDDEDGNVMWVEPPPWVTGASVDGRYVGNVSGSESKYLEDHNIQSTPIFRLGIGDEFEDDSALFFDGMVQPLQDQGYMVLDYDRPEMLRFDANIQAWREYYNLRTGEENETVLGTSISPNGLLPNTNRSTRFYGGGKPHTDWLRTRTGLVVDLPTRAWKDVWADFVYRRVKGEQSLLKGGTVFDPAATPPVVAGSGPGTVNFDISGRKDVDYETFGGIAGTRSSLFGLNWQLDLRGMKHDLNSTDREPDYGLAAGTSQLQYFEQDTDLKQVSGDLVVSRHIRPGFFVFGGVAASWERSDPDPSQFVQTGIRTPVSTLVQTRQTTGANVTRHGQAVTAGAVFMPISSVVMRADGSFRASQADGSLNEFRDESTLATGDVGSIANDSERDSYSGRARVKLDWQAARRLSVEGLAQFDYRHDQVKSSRILNFVVVEPSELEDYDADQSRVRAGVSARYRFRRGRSLEGGYEFSWVGYKNDTNELSNQFLMGDYDRYRHRLHLKGVARISRKLRGELRAHYVFENRDMDAPETQPPDIATADEGKIEYQSFAFTPVMIYQHSAEWSGVLSLSVGREWYTLVDDGPAPPFFSSRFSSFEYEALTETMTLGVNWVPSETQSHSFSYSLYHNSQNVDNLGQDASWQSSFEIVENWDLKGAVRYLSYLPDHSNPDDYHTVIVSIGIGGRF
jgi:hypothetical protein